MIGKALLSVCINDFVVSFYELVSCFLCPLLNISFFNDGESAPGALKSFMSQLLN